MPQCPDDLVPADHEVRTVVAVVETMDLSRFYEPIKTVEGDAGRNATDPALLVALWLYATIRGESSARRARRRGTRLGQDRRRPPAGRLRDGGDLLGDGHSKNTPPPHGRPRKGEFSHSLSE